MASSSGNGSTSGYERHNSRRTFLRKAAAVGVGAAGLAGVLAGCGGEGEERTRPDGDVQTPTGESPQPGLSEEVADCQSTEQLSEQDLNVRKALNYTPDSPEEGENCANCQFYEPPEGNASSGASVCGGCTLFPGPVVAGGWCTSWAAKRG